MALALVACSGMAQQLTLLQINDTYELTPLSGQGGMTRVATLRKQLVKENPATLLVHAGDFLNPSVLSALSYQGKRISGKQMIETLNAVGLDYTAFGNHEFDVKEADLLARLDESRFEWLAANVWHKTPQGQIPFSRTGQAAFPKSVIRKINGLRVGIIGVTIPLEKDFVLCTDPFTAAKTEYNRLKDSTDFVIAITHQSIDADKQLAKELPALKLIIGGHEHDNTAQQVGETLIRKADANAKTAYIHRINFDAATQKVSIVSELKKVDASLPDDSATAAVVSRWQQIATEGIKAVGFDAAEVLMQVKGEPLDGLEATVRNKHGKLTDIIAAAMLTHSKHAQAAIVNGGSVRIDDRLTGTVTAYDLMRIVPFGGGLVEMQIKGADLQKLLDAGLKNKGTGGYLHYANISESKKGWKINGKKLIPAKYYNIITTEFLFTGKEANMDFLIPQNPNIRNIDTPKTDDIRADIRKVIADYMRKIK
ncbi:5'-nucleotidase [Flexibacter flexilis DSM 6793]|uniref:5'-nucleotidase n=2 Tax=Flexibacter flexilis TaxID=998 RepID=A0A1I1FZF4_9BACT|nr:5'-nucleotidase [Flexibacter flexilis DSM 6793]